MSGEITEKNFIQHELIGLQASIIDTPCKSLANISGQVIDETMNTLKIEYIANDSLKSIIVPKHKTTFRFMLPVFGDDQNVKPVVINGSVLTKRPEDRIKKLAKIVQKANKKRV